MKNRYLTLDDLYTFYKNQNKSVAFSSNEAQGSVVVQVPTKFEIVQERDNNNLLFCKVKILHSGLNRNHSNVTDEALVKAGKQLAYKPVLANFCELTDKDGNTYKDFTSHDMIYNEDGSVEYIEHQIGCFTTDPAYTEVEEETGHNFLYGYCAIPREYTDATDIIERKNGTKVSCEIAINEMEYSVDDNCLLLTDIELLGVTCLGTNPDTGLEVQEGMQNARLDIVDFNKDNNSIVAYAEKLDSLQEKVDTLFSCLDIDTIKKGGSTEDMQDEILENDVVDTEAIAENSDTTDDVVVSDNIESNDVSVEADDTITEIDNVVTDDSEDVTEANQPEEDFDVAETVTEDSMTRSYSISHDDIRGGLYKLLIPVEEEFNEGYYIVNVYDGYFIYETYVGNKYYGQRYDVDKETDNISFVDERYELFAEFLTVSEKAQLDAMRSNYEALVQFKADVEAKELHAQKEAIVYDDKYSVLSNNDAFKKLVSEMDNYSLNELETEVKVILADYVTNGGQFDYHSDAKVSKVGIANPNKKVKTKKYGNLFD